MATRRNQPGSRAARVSPIRVQFQQEKRAVEPMQVLDVQLTDEALQGLLDERRRSSKAVFSTLEMVQKDLIQFFPQVPQVLPRRLLGEVLLANGAPAVRLAVTADRPDLAAGASWPNPRATTNSLGMFTLELPTVPIPAGGLTLTVRGQNGSESVVLKRVDLLAPASAPHRILLAHHLDPLMTTILAGLAEVGEIVGSIEEIEENPDLGVTPPQPLCVGDEGCAQSFHSNAGVVDCYRYPLFIRLLEPRVFPKQIVIGRNNVVSHPVAVSNGRGLVTGLNLDVNRLSVLGGISFHFADRVPIDQAIDVTAFHRDVQRDPVDVPKASTIGLGYILRLRQVWIPAGHSLGDLLYSLALAPGEQQRIAVREQVETLAATDFESLSIDEQQRFRETAAGSTSAMFKSAYHEQASGGAHQETDSSSGGIGGGIGLGIPLPAGLLGIGVAGGYGSSSSSGDTSSWQRGSRDFTSSSAEDMHSSLNRRSSASRNAMRTSVRLATATERESITTRVVTNHNHCHALTMQYWQVLRHYTVTTEVDDCELVCCIPLEIVRFLPAGLPATLPSGTYTRDDLLARYALLIRYREVVASLVRRNAAYTHGLTLLEQFVANPTAVPQSSGTGLTQDVVQFRVSGTFLPYDSLYVTLVAKSGARVGPVKLTGSTSDISANTYHTRDEVIGRLQAIRRGNAGTTLTAAIAVPDSIARSDIARFDISRSSGPYTYRFPQPAISGLNFADYFNWLRVSSVTLGANELEQAVGAPFVWGVNATTQSSSVTLVEALVGQATEMGTTLPVATVRLPPILTFHDLLRIEAVFQHVLQNAVAYSKAVWLSLTAEERAILLERFTIGVPEGGVTDASQEVPLLNCIANEVIGFFGNSAVMRFFIPPALAAAMKTTTREVQENLLKFHRQAFVPPKSRITLPTHGMLGEAVLGCCDSCEKIDLTRFWNWQDSPADSAESIKPADLASANLLAQANAAPSAALVPTQPVTLMNIGNSGAASSPQTALAEALLKASPALGAFGDITGRAQLTELQKATLDNAGQARQQAISAGTDLAKSALAALPEVIKSQKPEAAKGGGEEKKKLSPSEKTAAIAKLKTSLPDFLAIAGAAPTQASATEKANSILGSLFGTDKPALAELTEIAPLLTAAAGDDAVAALGKLAFIAALGL